MDLCGQGRFTLLTAIGGEAWSTAADAVSARLGVPVQVYVIGPNQRYADYTGDWARIREVRDSGCLLVRPDHHVPWRSTTLSEDTKNDLSRVLKSVLAR